MKASPTKEPELKSQPHNLMTCEFVFTEALAIGKENERSRLVFTALYLSLGHNKRTA